MSLIDDLKHPFRYGNVIAQLIIVNVAVFVLFMLFQLVIILMGYSREELFIISETVRHNMSLPVEPVQILYKPWTIITHMFMHAGGGHIFWNMIVLYFFGSIFQELTGSKRILAIYILGGLAGALLAVVGLNLIPAVGDIKGGYMLGASAAVNALVLASATLMPDYSVNLLIIGRVQLKFIALIYLVIDIAGIASLVNTGGHIAHIGGALFGVIFVVLLRKGTDLSRGFNKFISFFKRLFSGSGKPRMRAVRGGGRGVSDNDTSYSKADKQRRIDSILDKINKSGYESLSKEEKEFLYNNSRDV
jgi:membrane associated rhomboid family serine protease